MGRAAMIGQRFGRLVVVSKSDVIHSNTRYWVCICDCGATKIISTGNLSRTTSCGCLRKDKSKILLDSRRSVIEKMYQEGCTQQEIASAVGVDRVLISKMLVRLDIEKRITTPRPNIGARNGMWKEGRVGVGRGSYIRISIPGHPRATGQCNYVPEHIIVMEKHIGRYLIFISKGHKDNEIVHHKNKDKTDNTIDNLQLMTHSEHMRMHGEMNVRNIYKNKL